jgi:hypothetical protein
LRGDDSLATGEHDGADSRGSKRNSPPHENVERHTRLTRVEHLSLGNQYESL